jgi:homoserine kinase type II
MDVYLVQHSRETEGDEDTKIIGIYSSEIAAQSAVERLKLKPGFSSYPEGFHVDRYRIDKDHWPDGFVLD